MIPDFQQTTMSSIGLLAQATVCSSSAELRRRFCSHIILSSPVKPTASPCVPGHRHPVKELHSVGDVGEMARYCTSTTVLDANPGRLESRDLFLPQATRCPRLPSQRYQKVYTLHEKNNLRPDGDGVFDDSAVGTSTTVTSTWPSWYPRFVPPIVNTLSPSNKLDRGVTWRTII